ncbi:MAG: zeta toxin family protein [Bacteroides sp.]|nr:zeta toxin family protein [Bacteroides sp.]MCM1378884.1 zeta toxin family protein [Bacteroides sp.]MCM1445500.1 zeta toxin family protein [Prevotella sp.]
MNNEPSLYIIAGCNGAGKTTASFTILPEILQCREFVNADEIARGISPFNPEAVAVQAGRLMLERIDELLVERKTFAIETTLATRSYRNLVDRAHRSGYRVALLFFWLPTVDLAKERVGLRVAAGGHNIPVDVIERRYINGINNLFKIFMPIVDVLLIYDNENSTDLVASNDCIKNSIKFKTLKSYVK